VFLPGIVLEATLLGIGVIAASDGTDLWRLVLLAVGAGALGNTLSGVFELRRLAEMTEVKQFSLPVLVQPFLGAAAGLVGLLVVRSGLITIARLPRTGWTPVGLVAFAIGFSEPFFLKTVARLTASDSGGPQQGLDLRDTRRTGIR